MRIGIITLPLYTNYGGILQAYALQTVLERMGHEVWVEYRRNNKYNIRKYIRPILLFILSLFFSRVRRIYIPTEKEENIIGQYVNQFVFKYINRTVPIYTRSKKLLRPYQFDAFVVGSDQIWRPRYSRGLTNAFLDFTEGENVKRISYAASFGTDVWEFTRRQTKKCAKLVKRFDAVSVREDSAVLLCKKYLDVDAIHLLDPTLLLKKENYLRLIDRNIQMSKIEPVLFVYILDNSLEKQKIVETVSSRLSLNAISIMPHKRFEEVGSKYIDECVFPPVSDWLNGFECAKYVITDSFHGTVFSIIFNKPFIVVANKGRGLSRFTSLLKKFDLEDRLIYSIKDLSEKIIYSPIDFDRVNNIRNREIEKSLKFLNDVLC